jgi:hypothetical protein
MIRAIPARADLLRLLPPIPDALSTLQGTGQGMADFAIWPVALTNVSNFSRKLRGSIAEKTRHRAWAHALSTACNRRPRPSTKRDWRDIRSVIPDPTKSGGPHPGNKTPWARRLTWAFDDFFAEHVMDGAAIETRCGADEATDDQPRKQLYHAAFMSTPEPPRAVGIRPPCCS